MIIIQILLKPVTNINLVPAHNVFHFLFLELCAIILFIKNKCISLDFMFCPSTNSYSRFHG